MTHGRVIGGEIDSHDQFQHLITRATGVMFVIGGTSLIVEACADQTSPPKANDLGTVRPTIAMYAPKSEQRHAAMRGLLAQANWKEPPV